MGLAMSSALRAFKMPGNPTSIEVGEMDDGNICIRLETTRRGMEPLYTLMYLQPQALELLSVALHRAAHDPSVWLPFPEDDDE